MSGKKIDKWPNFVEFVVFGVILGRAQVNVNKMGESHDHCVVCPGHNYGIGYNMVNGVCGSI